jgi:hypothetical protein
MLRHSKSTHQEGSRMNRAPSAVRSRLRRGRYPLAARLGLFAAVVGVLALPVSAHATAITSATNINFDHPEAPAPAGDDGTPGHGGWDSGYSIDGTVAITATGSVSWIEGCTNPWGLSCPVGPNGAYAIDDPTHTPVLSTGGGNVLDGAPLFSLLVRVAGGPWQFVGDGPTQVSGAGELYFVVNDSYFADNSGHFDVTVTKRTTSTSLSCTAIKPTLQHCTATVTDNAPGTQTTPTGTVSFTSSGVGAFSSSQCTLAGSDRSASCLVYYATSARGSREQTITADYSGDSTHATSSGSSQLTWAPSSGA